jgi:GntR family transcriptional repressor for pyruvate dehydrogenase complex
VAERPKKLARSSKGGIVAKATSKLRALSLEHAEGAYLGSQEELTQRLGVGRVTLQQAAHILERQRLISVRRGVNGGYFASRPDERGVQEALETYVQSRRVDFRDVHQISNLLGTEMARLASLARDAEGEARLRDVIERMSRIDLQDGPSEMLQVDLELTKAICALAANPLGEIVLLATWRLFFSTGPGDIVPTQEDREAWRRARLNLAQAVLAHDEHLAQIINRKFGTELQARMTQLHEAATQAKAPGEPQPPSRTEQATKARDKLEPSEL